MTDPTAVAVTALLTPFLLLAPFVVATVLRRVRARRRMNLLFARPCGDHDVTPGSVPVRPPAESGVTYHPRTLHLVSASPDAHPVERPRDPGSPVPAPLPVRRGAGDRFVDWLDRRLVPICVTLLGGAFAGLAATFLVVVG